jgi:hypothetical protein
MKPGDRSIRQPLDTAEIDAVRDRRATISSPIPAILAETDVRAKPAPRDPAAPLPERPERTRRVGESDRQHVREPSSPVLDESVAACRQRAALRIDEARAALDAGEITHAVVAAEAALVESDEAPSPGIVEVIEPARPLLGRVFEAYIGPPGGIPVLAPRAHEIARARLNDAERAVLGRIDGVKTLEQLFDGSGLGSTDAMRLAARLIHSGAVRIV